MSGAREKTDLHQQGGHVTAAGEVLADPGGRKIHHRSIYQSDVASDVALAAMLPEHFQQSRGVVPGSGIDGNLIFGKDSPGTPPARQSL